jgi:hypothetical protein
LAGPRHRDTGVALQTQSEILSRLNLPQEARQSRERALAIASGSNGGGLAALTVDWNTLKRETGR